MKGKRFIRVLSVALVLLMILPVLSVIPVCGADEPGQSDDPGHVIYFNAKVSGWSGYSLIMVYCFCYETGDVQIQWAAKKTGGMTDMGNGIWSYDFDEKGITLDDSKQYCLIFQTDNGIQTQELLFDTTCFGDTVIPDDAKEAEVYYDINKRAIFAYWQSGKLGPAMHITDLGHVIGDICPAYTTPYAMFVDFLANTGKRSLQNALNMELWYGDGKTAQELIDEVSQGLNLTRDDVEKAIEDAKEWGQDWSEDWNYRKSAAYQRGDYDGDCVITIMDATRVQNLIAEVVLKPTAAFLRAIDADGDGVLTIMDATRIQNVIAYLMNMEGEYLWGHTDDGVAD
ncbi:MAG: hypothetical protein IJ639_06825 [Ruminococcus sp.]|nr:hypothetical protein [Ruminococcus sp.]